MREKTSRARITGLVLLVAATVATTLQAQDDAKWRAALQEAASARRSGRVEEVEKILRGALEEAEKFGPDDERVLLSLDALGTYYYTQGVFIEALPIYRRVLEIQERTLGPDHPAVAEALNDVAVIESIQGKHAEATANSERALKIIERAAEGMVGVIALAAGGNHTCAILSSGQAGCWGSNVTGQLGGPGPMYSSTPAVVPSLGSAVALAAGSNFTCTLLADHTVTCWGANGSGQTGAAASQVSGPARVGGIVDAQAIAAGAEHACALLADGKVKCWGNNEQGQLGNGATANSSAPVEASGLANATSIAAGGRHTCALAADGSAWCWGSNNSGQLGNANTEPAPTPVRVAGLGAAAKGLAAGINHTCALLADGSVACWGRNQSGQLGISPSAEVSGPVRVAALSSVRAVAAGYSHTCALLEDGTLKCWGNNQAGQLGDGKTANSSSPALVAGVSGATAVVAGITHTCAVLADTTIRCWGTDSYGAPKGVTFSLRSPLPVTVGGNPSGLITALSTLAGVHSASGKFDLAEPLFRRALDLAEKTFANDDPALAAILSGYAEMLRKAGRPEEAAKIDARAQAVTEKPVLTDVPTVPPTER